jgi:hypothetical protein
MGKRGQARAMLAKIVHLPFEAQTAHPVNDALQVLRGLYACKAYALLICIETHPHLTG